MRGFEPLGLRATDCKFTLDPKFSTYTTVSINDKAAFTASKVVVPKPLVDDFTYINGVDHWRTPELAAAPSGQAERGILMPT